MAYDRLERPSTRDQINDQNHHGYDQDQVDELAAEMADEAEEPENQQNNKDSPEHKVSFGLSFLCFVRGGLPALMDFSRLARFLAILRLLHKFKQISGGQN
jgi:hypothetical protein